MNQRINWACVCIGTLCIDLSSITIHDLQVRMIGELLLASSKDLHGESCRLPLIISMKEMFLDREVSVKSTREFFRTRLRLL